MGFESVEPIRPKKSEEDLIWENRANKEPSWLGEKLMDGTIKIEEAKRKQRENTARAIQKKGTEEGGWILETSRGNIALDNLAETIKWANQNGGLVYEEDGLTLIAGETVDSILERKAKMREGDKARAREKAE